MGLFSAFFGRSNTPRYDNHPEVLKQIAGSLAVTAVRDMFMPTGCAFLDLFIANSGNIICIQDCGYDSTPLYTREARNMKAYSFQFSSFGMTGIGTTDSESHSFLRALLPHLRDCIEQEVRRRHSGNVNINVDMSTYRIENNWTDDELISSIDISLYENLGDSGRYKKSTPTLKEW